jgi:DNA-binding SARP family transcriptional activator/TolB-like protein
LSARISNDKIGGLEVGVSESMSKLSNVTLHLLGPFAIDANVGRPISISVRSKKARALLAYLAMKPDYRARREELATLFWGDNPDILARHSLRQCLISLRQDLCLASEILLVDRETIGLHAQLVVVDARAFMSLARSGGPIKLARAAELWRGAFLSDLTLDIEEFDTWRAQEANRLSAVAAGVFAALCRSADANGDGDRAIVAAERLVALDPALEGRQRAVLKLIARHKGREAALSRAKLLTDLLRSELDVSPEAETRALIDAIKRGDFEPPDAAHGEHTSTHSVVEPVNVPNTSPVSSVSCAPEGSSVSPPSLLATTQVRGAAAPATLRFWHRWPLAAALSTITVLAIIAVLGLANGPKLLLPLTNPRHNQGIVVLPFTVDSPEQSSNPAFARALTNDLIGYLSRFGNLRVISEPTSQFYRDRQMDTNLMSDLGVQYAVAGHVQTNDSTLRIDLQLVDTATQTNVWSDNLQREHGDPTLVADEAARGIARAIAIQIDRLAALEVRAKPNSQLTLTELVARGYLALQRGITRETLSEAMKSFDEALRRDPHYQPALLAVARVDIFAVTNFIDFDPPPDLNEAERVLNEVLGKFPNSISALYSLALLQKHRRQYQATVWSLRRCLEINPSFLPAQAQIGAILTRTGQPQKGLEQILQTIRVATPNDPSIGYWYLFAAEAELELGHNQTALDWAMRAKTFMPASPLVHVWLASIYATLGDKSNTGIYAAALMKMAPDRTRLFMKSAGKDDNPLNGPRRPLIFEGLRLALSTLPG